MQILFKDLTPGVSCSYASVPRLTRAFGNSVRWSVRKLAGITGGLTVVVSFAHWTPPTTFYPPPNPSPPSPLWRRRSIWRANTHKSIWASKTHKQLPSQSCPTQWLTPSCLPTKQEPVVGWRINALCWWENSIHSPQKSPYKVQRLAATWWEACSVLRRHSTFPGRHDGESVRRK